MPIIKSHNEFKTRCPHVVLIDNFILKQENLDELIKVRFFLDRLSF